MRERSAARLVRLHSNARQLVSTINDGQHSLKRARALLGGGKNEER